MTNPYDSDYFLNGPGTGKSNYVDYQWRPGLTIPACRKIAQYLGIRNGDSLIDVGCSRGYYVKAFRELGYRAFGYDVSEWAIENCDPDVGEFVGRTLPKRAFDWATCKDVAEHLALGELKSLVSVLNERITRGMLFIVPLARRGAYVRQEDENDITHIIRMDLDGWISLLEENAPDFNVNGSYNIHGIKPAAAEVWHSCGFLTLIRP